MGRLAHMFVTLFYADFLFKHRKTKKTSFKRKIKREKIKVG